jgi:hypothetical protein
MKFDYLVEKVTFYRIDPEGFENLQGLGKLKYYCFTTAFFQIQLQSQFIVVFAVDEVVGLFFDLFFSKQLKHRDGFLHNIVEFK